MRSYDQYSGAWDTNVKVRALGKVRENGLRGGLSLPAGA